MEFPINNCDIFLTFTALNDIFDDQKDLKVINKIVHPKNKNFAVDLAMPFKIPVTFFLLIQ